MEGTQRQRSLDIPPLNDDNDDDDDKCMISRVSTILISAYCYNFFYKL